MLDFLKVATKTLKNGYIEVYPKFTIKKSQDLMIRGGDFYAIWVEEFGVWSTDEDDALQIIDNQIYKYYEDNKDAFGTNVQICYLRDAESGMIDKWHKYCQKQMRDSFVPLDEKMIFSNDPVNKKDYSSKRLSYPLEKGSIKAFDRLISTLYLPDERQKIEWAIGAIVSGESKHIQKFMVLYGAAGTGKSTILNIIQQLFEGYYSVFDAKALGSASNQFALEAFRTNPLVAIQHDGDLSKIEDNTRLNSLVSHELMIINEKFKSPYATRFNAFLLMGTNKPVKITDAKSGLIRRLIDVSPSGNKLPSKEYKRLMNQVQFELGAIAYHCKEVYLSDPSKYDSYIPMSMMSASNDFYNFMEEYYHVFKAEDCTTRNISWAMYKEYCDEAKVPYPLSQRIFLDELRNYFDEFYDVYVTKDGKRHRNYYKGFKSNKFDSIICYEEKDCEIPKIVFEETESIFDKECSEYQAQYANEEGTPTNRWDLVTTKLRHLDTSKLHYVNLPENHIVIDFDIPNEKGEKDFQKNLEEASKWPATYAELSKSGAGIHLHYIYNGDVSKLSRIYDDYIEVKIFNGNSSLRRQLTKCNKLPINTINSGLPMKKEKKMINFEGVKSERSLREQIRKNLNKEVHGATKPSIDFIYKILEDAYNSDLNYDVSDLRNSVLAFGAQSTNQADYCIKLVSKMKFKSADYSESHDKREAPIAFYDVEVFPNLFLVNWKYPGENATVVRMINPSPTDIESLLKMRLIGFNCRRYDNHILYARMMGFSNMGLYKLSQKIISGDKTILFGEAYNISYTDVYDFCSKKQSLKKWEIELGIHHKELGLPWDQPVPKDRWTEVAEYCDNDVIATEAVFNARQSDFIAREVLAEVAELTVNDTTNSLTTRIIFGKNKKPQDQFNYRDMGSMDISDTFDMDDEFTRFDKFGRPIYPGYKYEFGKSTYRGEEVGEGGYVYAEPGMYSNVALLDIASMHPSSVIAEQLFGEEYTRRFQEIRDARVAIKHKDFEKAKTMLNGTLAKYLTDDKSAKDLAQALKIAINSVYGLTSARFDNPFRDPRNVDNIVAKRGALFMINLKHQVKKRGYSVAHIKTDSIKIPNATPEIIQFVMDYGKRYGYIFEHEATYDRMCLVNDAVYIAKDAADGQWTATGAQFQVPYVFKRLFTKEPIEFEDMCETKAVSKGLLYLDMNESMIDVSNEEKEYEKLLKKTDYPKNKDRIEELSKIIEQGHRYVFVGKVGQFCPIKPGCKGGVLYRESEGKYYAAAGTKGYRWLESEMIKNLGREDDIDKSYYEDLCNDAIDTISKYGDFYRFASGDPLIINVDPIQSDPLPF